MNSPIHVVVYQILANQSNQAAEQTLLIVHSEQSFRNAKSMVASASAIANADESDFERVQT